MFCLYCGKEIPDHSKFCSFCGRKISAKEGNTFSGSEGGDAHDAVSVQMLLKQVRDAKEIIHTIFECGNSAIDAEYASLWNKEAFWHTYALKVVMGTPKRITHFIASFILICATVTSFYCWYEFKDQYAKVGLISFIMFVIGMILNIFLATMTLRKSRKLKKISEEYKKQALGYFTDHGRELDFLQESYRTPTAIDYIADLFECGRVVTLHQAYDKCDQYEKYRTSDENFSEIVNYIKGTAKLVI